jgi:hypothetical protein
VFLLVTLAARSGKARDDATDAPRVVPDPLEALRTRFRDGMEKYKASAFADAVVIWEAVYRDLGPDAGYRVAFDLARAYDELGDAIKAADDYDTYLAKVDARRAGAEQLEPNVEKQEGIARQRIHEIAASKGRIVIHAAPRTTTLVRVDNAAARMAPVVFYVEPGSHTVSFVGRTPTAVQTIVLAAGEMKSIESPHETETDARPALPATHGAANLKVSTTPPFPQAVLWIAGGLTLASVAAPALTYSRALGVKHDYDSESSPDARTRLASDYASARESAYLSLALPALFATAFAGLTVWYAMGKSNRAAASPSAWVTSDGTTSGFGGRF